MSGGGIVALPSECNAPMKTTRMKPEERLVAGFVGLMVGFFAFAYGKPVQKVLIGGFAVVVLVVAALGRNPLAGRAKE
ncbi:hypothetical protein DAERI_060169 [Deinococcus aerius]|uniref:Uncharacterized protein n=2 Tax=Deinococcus aerius TaxID=200253 RepID=A0A2I9CVE9_9DEIO|nr:hypothetical protein DAERI_060169 [Deinococcus aerius]